MLDFDRAARSRACRRNTKAEVVAALGRGLAYPFTQDVRLHSDGALNQALTGDEWVLDGSRLYMLEFAGASPATRDVPVGQYVKVGRVGKRREPATTKTLDNRLLEHRSMAGVHGYALVDAWLSPRLEDPEQVELCVLSIVRERFPEPRLFRPRGEYFRNVPFEELVQMVEGIDGGWEPLMVK